MESKKILEIYKIFKKYNNYYDKFKNYLIKNNLLLSFYNYEKDKEKDKELIKIIGKKFKSIFLPMNQLLYKIVFLYKSLSNYFKVFKNFNLNNYKKLLKGNDIEGILKEYLIIKNKFKYNLSYRYLNENIFINIKGNKYKYYNKIYKERKYDKCFNVNCRNIEEYKELTENKLKFYMEKEKKKRNIILKNIFISSKFNDYYSCIYNNCNKEFLLYLKSYIIYIFTIFCLKNDCIKYDKYKNKYKNKYLLLINSLKKKKYTLKEFIIIIKNYWKFLNIIIFF